MFERTCPFTAIHCRATRTQSHCVRAEPFVTAVVVLLTEHRETPSRAVSCRILANKIHECPADPLASLLPPFVILFDTFHIIIITIIFIDDIFYFFLLSYVSFMVNRIVVICIEYPFFFLLQMLTIFFSLTFIMICCYSLLSYIPFSRCLFIYLFCNYIDFIVAIVIEIVAFVLLFFCYYFNGYFFIF